MNKDHSYILVATHLFWTLLVQATIAKGEDRFRTMQNSEGTFRYLIYSPNHTDPPSSLSNVSTLHYDKACKEQVNYFDDQRQQKRVLCLMGNAPFPAVRGHADSFYYFGDIHGLFAIRGDSVVPLFGDSICGIETPKIFKNNYITPSRLKHLFCLDHSLILDDYLFLPNKIKKKIFTNRESAISKWKANEAFVILGNKGTMLKINKGKVRQIGKRRLPPLSSFDKMQAYEFNGYKDHCYIYGQENKIVSMLGIDGDRFFPEGESTDVGRSGCFFWGSESPWVYCPKNDGLDSFPRFPYLKRQWSNPVDSEILPNPSFPRSSPATR